MQKDFSEGEQIMRIDFDQPEDCEIYRIKQKAAELINLIGDSAPKSIFSKNSRERLGLAVRAIETCEIAAMLAVKSIES